MSEELKSAELDERALREIGEKWGYYSLPRPHGGELGYGGLLVSIREKPTGEHFDPQRLHICLRNRHGLPQQRTLSSLSRPEPVEHVCPGKLSLSDRLDKRIDFFSFGGSLELLAEQKGLLLLLRSPAPILELTEQRQTASDHWAADTEALMSQVRARWERDDEGFDRRLAAVDPFQLYLASLNSLLVYWHEPGRAMEETHHRSYKLLLLEREELLSRGLWPADPPTIEGLLAPDRSGPE